MTHWEIFPPRKRLKSLSATHAKSNRKEGGLPNTLSIQKS